MPDINCLDDGAREVSVDQPSNLLYDAAPSPNIPSGVFVQIPIDADDLLWRFDNAGLAGRIQQDAANNQLVVTEPGAYSGHCAVRINATSIQTFFGEEPSIVELQVRINGVPRREKVRRSPDGWDLNADDFVFFPFNYGIALSLPFTIYLDAGDTVQLWFRATATLGGSFPRLTQPEYGLVDISKVGEVKSPISGPDIDCDPQTDPVTGKMQAHVAARTADSPAALFPTVDRYFFQTPADHTVIIDEGGDGLGADIASYGGGVPAVLPFQYATELLNLEALSIWRESICNEYVVNPANTEPFRWLNAHYFSQPNSFSGNQSRAMNRILAGVGLGQVANEGTAGYQEHTGGCFHLNFQPIFHRQEFQALQQSDALQFWPANRSFVSVLTIGLNI